MSEEQQQAANFFCKYCNTTLLGWLEADSHAEVCPSNSNSGLASGGTLLEQDGASSDEFEGIVDELELGEQAEVGQKSVNVSPSVNWTVLKGLLRSSAGSDNKAKKFKNKRRSRTEDGIMRLPCIHCDKTFSRKDKVAAHVKKVHFDHQDTLDESSGPGSEGGDELRSYTCDACPKAFKNSSHLYRHKTSVHSNVVISCDDCGKQFSRRDKLNTHIKNIHHNASSFPNEVNF